MKKAELDRTRLPVLPEYVETAGHRVVGRGRRRRADCLLADHSHRLSMAIDAEQGLWFCHACGEGGDVLELHRRRFGLSFVDAARALGALVDMNEDKDKAADPSAARPAPARPRPARPVDPDPDEARKRATAARIWRETRPLTGSPGELYLRRRGCAMPPADGDLRYHPDLHLFGFVGPALVGLITNALDARKGVGLHLTWLRREGDRWVRGERRYLGRKAGGVVRLWPDEAVTRGLAIAEGIETALAVARVFTPVWSVLDAGNLGAFPVLHGEAALSVFADRDASGTGQRAAAACAERWRDAGREVRVLAALHTGADMADIAAGVTA